VEETDRVESDEVGGDLECFEMKAKRYRVGYYLYAQKYNKQFLTRIAADSFGIQIETVLV
jgi:hypothetical protein